MAFAKLSDLSAHLAVDLRVPYGEVREIMRALKEQSDNFADWTAALPNQIRSRPDALTDNSMLRTPGGPGRGLIATPPLTAMVILAIALNPPRKTAALTVWRTWHLANGRSDPVTLKEDVRQILAPCRLTGSVLFGQALTKLLEEPDLTRRVVELRLDLDGSSAALRFDDSSSSLFGPAVVPASYPRNLRREAVLNGEVLFTIANRMIGEAA